MTLSSASLIFSQLQNSARNRRAVGSVLSARQVYQLLLLIAVSTLALGFSSLAKAVGDDVDAVEVRKSPNDSLEYRSVTLDNGLSVFLIHDADAKKAAASLDVAIGSGSNPADREGLAHFLEHMLFLGTEKYPDSGEYSRFITNHGGSNNAFTSFEDTNYHFDVEAGYLEPALDRFAQFFISPLFNNDLVEREKHAVHSEFSGRRREDGRRILDAKRQAYNSEHPMSRFFTGSLETLEDRENSKIRDEMIAFYEKYYSANIMTLSVYGTESLDQLEALVRSKFDAVPNRNSKRQQFSLPLYKVSDLPRRMDVQSLKDQRYIALDFELDYSPDYKDTKPNHFIGHLLGHEGEGSLLSALKQRGYADKLSAGGSISERRPSTFSINITLTPAGLAHVNEIVEIVFATIELIKREGINERYHDENKRLADIEFRYREKDEPLSMVISTARLLHEWPAADVLVGYSEVKRFDPSHIRAVLDQLNPQRLMLTVVAPDAQADEVTRFFETPYSLNGIDDALVKQWSVAKPLADIKLPPENPFIPRRLELVEDTGSEVPVRLDSVEDVELWHQSDTSFNVPKASFYVSIRSAEANSSARNWVLSQLFVNLVNEKLNEFAYPAALAGLDYELYRHSRGFSFRISGYSDGQELILARILDALKTPNFSRQQFERIRDDLIREINDLRKQPPYLQTTSQVHELLLVPYWSHAAQIEAARSLSVSDVTAHANALMKDVVPVALSHGNISQEASIARVKMVRDSFGGDVSATGINKPVVVRLEKNDRIGRDLSIEHNDSAVTLYLQADSKSVESQARFSMLSQILSQPFYQDIRTAQQLGYFVSASQQYVIGVPGIRFSVQSPQSSPEKMIGRIEQFIVNFKPKLEDITAEEFSRHLDAVISQVVEPEKRLSVRSQRYWWDIDRQEYGFDYREKLVTALKATTKADIVQLYQDLLIDKTRGSVITWSRGKLATETDKLLKVELPENYDNLEKFKFEREKFPQNP